MFFSSLETNAVVLKETMQPVGSIGLMIGFTSNIGIPDTEGGDWLLDRSSVLGSGSYTRSSS